jgi:hypothetical protein
VRYTSLLRCGCVRRAVVAAVVLGGTVGALVAPASSHAGQCSVGEFCLWSSFAQTGGLYHYAGSDSTLWNDRFENEDTALVVANSANSWWNRGTTVGGPAQVRLFTDVNGRGAFTCAPQGSSGNFIYDRSNDVLWKNEVESFEWRSSC